MNKLCSIPLKNIEIDDTFWNRYITLVREKVIPYQWEILNDRVENAEKSHCIKNFQIAAKDLDGKYYGNVFQDSDLYKWLESAAYSLATKPDPTLEKITDLAVDLIAGAQQHDGYINTYYTIKEPLKRWTNLQEGHELYCAGHFIEAAVAYFEATGKKKILEIACKFADYINDVFGTDVGKICGYPGHQVIELALFRLYNTTNNKTYLKLSQYFISERGKKPNYFDLEQEKPVYENIFEELKVMKRDYSQSHEPPVYQAYACGHAVRAVYMYSAMADLSWECEDSNLLKTCNKLYESITQRQMYITGAIGSTALGERFSTDYNLPNDTVYGETCASIGLIMFCNRMNHIQQDSKFIDTLEQALYNTVISGIALSGTEFFYVNPLKVVPELCNQNPIYAHIKPQRQKWFSVACCPTNIARTIMSLGNYIYAIEENRIFINLYISSTANYDFNGNKATININTTYPYGNTAIIQAEGGEFEILLRSPKNAPIQHILINGVAVEFTIKNGYVMLSRDWDKNSIAIEFDIQPKLIYSNVKVGSNIGKSAIVRGPFVYCVEEDDNGENLDSLVLSPDAQFEICKPPKEFPPETTVLSVNCLKAANTHQDNSLYTQSPPTLTESKLIAIPYFLWANRVMGEMSVYINTKLQ